MTAPNQIDAFMGEGYYDEWRKMNRQLEAENKRFEQVKKNLNMPFSPVVDRAYDDFGRVNEIAKNYGMAMNSVLLNRPVAKVKIEKLHDLYTLAIILAEEQNDLLETFWATGFAAAWVLFPFMLLQAKANLMLAALTALQEELKKAEKEVSNAKTKSYIHAAVFFFEAMFPEISLTARAALYLGDVVLDKALGPSDASMKQKLIGDTVPGIKQFSEAVHHIPEYGKAAHAVAERAGKAAGLATFYFDFSEIREGKEAVEKIEGMIERVKKAHEELSKVIEDNSARIDTFLRSLNRAVEVIEAARQVADAARRRLADDAAAYGYKSANALAWLSVP